MLSDIRKLGIFNYLGLIYCYLTIWALRKYVGVISNQSKSTASKPIHKDTNVLFGQYNHNKYCARTEYSLYILYVYNKHTYMVKMRVLFGLIKCERLPNKLKAELTTPSLLKTFTI